MRPESRARIKTGLRVLLGLLMIGAGVMHFVTPDFYLAIMPDYLPWHLGLVYLSGVAEIVLGAAVFVPDPKWRGLAGWGLVALFVAVLPANAWMATEGAPPGIKGLSLFVAPKYLPNPDGSIGAFNHLKATGVEEKMGMHASATCSISYGEDGPCRAWIIGEEQA